MLQRGAFLCESGSKLQTHCKIHVEFDNKLLLRMHKELKSIQRKKHFECAILKLSQFKAVVYCKSRVGFP